MGVLLGDITGEGVVSNTDVAVAKAEVAAPVTSSNFRNDVNANGIISNADVSTTKAQVGTSLPSPPISQDNNTAGWRGDRWRTLIQGPRKNW